MNVYEIVTEKIIEKLETGTVPWRKPWRANQELPKNLISGKEYRGLNLILLNMSEYTSSYWLTAKQAKDLKGNIKKGEKSTVVIFWKKCKSTKKYTRSNRRRY